MMSASTFKLHMTLLRHMRGAVDAYKEWIKTNQPVDTVDPIAHFKEQANNFDSSSSKNANTPSTQR